MTAATTTAEDVAVELVALKTALQQIVWTVAGTTSEPEGLAEWAQRTPVAFPQDAEHPGHYEPSFNMRLARRADEIEAETWRAISCFAAAAARSCSTLAREYPGGQTQNAGDDLSVALSAASRDLADAADAARRGDLSAAARTADDVRSQLPAFLTPRLFAPEEDRNA